MVGCSNPELERKRTCDRFPTDMSLPFVPRNVKRKSTVKNPSVAHNAEPGPLRIPPPKPDEKPPLDEKPRLSEEDYTILVTLALSDYALFCDPDLRRKIDQSEEKCMFFHVSWYKSNFSI